MLADTALDDQWEMNAAAGPASWTADVSVGGGPSEGGRGKGVPCDRKARHFHFYYGNWVKVEGGLNSFWGKSATARQSRQEKGTGKTRPTYERLIFTELEKKNAVSKQHLGSKWMSFPCWQQRERQLRHKKRQQMRFICEKTKLNREKWKHTIQRDKDTSGWVVGCASYPQSKMNHSSQQSGAIRFVRQHEDCPFVSKKDISAKNKNTYKLWHDSLSPWFNLQSTVYSFQRGEGTFLFKTTLKSFRGGYRNKLIKAEIIFNLKT